MHSLLGIEGCSGITILVVLSSIPSPLIVFLLFDQQREVLVVGLVGLLNVQF
jgi:hypothetical protein